MAPSNFIPTPNPLGLSSTRLVQNLWMPQQQPTSLKLTKNADYYEQRCVKFPDRGCFHCYAEFVHALLLEADAAVTRFVPQPYQTYVNRKPYIPDVYVARGGQVEVLELKQRGEMEPALEVPLRAFFEQHGIRFRVLANETVLEQEQLALNWLPLVQILAQAHFEGIDTDFLEQKLLGLARNESSVTVEELLGQNPRGESYFNELALFRLLHRHELDCDLTNNPLDYRTEVTAWR